MLDEGRDFLFADAEDLTEIARTGRLGGEEIRRILLPGSMSSDRRRSPRCGS